MSETPGIEEDGVLRTKKGSGLINSIASHGLICTTRHRVLSLEYGIFVIYNMHVSVPGKNSSILVSCLSQEIE